MAELLFSLNRSGSFSSPALRSWRASTQLILSTHLYLLVSKARIASFLNRPWTLSYRPNAIHDSQSSIRVCKKFFLAFKAIVFEPKFIIRQTFYIIYSDIIIAVVIVIVIIKSSSSSYIFGHLFIYFSNSRFRLLLEWFHLLTATLRILFNFTPNIHIIYIDFKASVI